MKRRDFLKFGALPAISSMPASFADFSYATTATSHHSNEWALTAGQRSQGYTALRQRILNEHPMLYRGPLISHIELIPSSSPFRAKAIRVGAGWLPLLIRLSDLIETEIARLRAVERVTEEELPVALCVKKKLGRLKFFVRNQNESIHSAILAASEESTHICDVCGVLRGAQNRFQNHLKETRCDACMTMA